MPGRIARTIIGLLLLSLAALAGAVEVQGVRMWPAPDNTRLVFDLTAPVTHNLFSLEGPDRIVIDLKGTRLAKPIVGLDYSEGLLKGIRSAPRNGGDLRVVLDLKAQVRPKSFVLKPSHEYGHRLVVDLHEASGSQKEQPVKRVAASRRELFIAIDAGHGGEDPGAVGPRGTREKVVVLAIARRLARLVEQEQGMRPILIRTGDYFVPLHKRMDKARQQRADLFISIHADSFRDHRARGSSVYTLSRRGATSEHAKWLAEKENASDLVGGVSLGDKDNLLKSVLLDLSQTATNSASTELADAILDNLKRVSRVHKRKVEKAAFRVLKAPDVPSVLVETAFISNPQEEQALRSSAHQQKLAEAMMEGIRHYFRQNPPSGTLMAQAPQQHVISRGETLSEIARQYHVKLDSLRRANGLRSDLVHVGDVLQIPTASDG